MNASMLGASSRNAAMQQQQPHQAAGAMGFAAPDGAESAVMRHFPRPPGTAGSGGGSSANNNTNNGGSRPNTTTSSRPPLPPVPRLQLTAAEERFRGARITPQTSGRPSTTPASASLATSSGKQPGRAGVADLPAPLGGGGSSARARTPAHPLFPTSLDPDRRVPVPDYRTNTKWFNDGQAQKHVVVGPQLRPNAATSLHSPRLVKNTGCKKEALEMIAEVLGGSIPLNLQVIAHTLLLQLPRIQSTDYTCAAFTDALAALDMPDVVFAQELFQKLDTSKHGRVPLTTIMTVFDICVNSEMYKAKVRTHCFDLFKQNGFIHLANLDDLKHIAGKDHRFRASGATPDMVRVLGDVFKEARRVEEETYISEVLLKKGKKKKKKKAPPLKPYQKSHIPVAMARVSHLDAGDFGNFFETNKELAPAFFPRWIRYMASDPSLNHACVMRALDLAEHAESARQQPADADTSSL